MDEKKIRPAACLELSRRIFQLFAKPYLLAASADSDGGGGAKGGAEQMESIVGGGSGSAVSAEGMAAGGKLVTLIEKMAASNTRVLDQVAACTTLPLHRCPRITPPLSPNALHRIPYWTL